MLIYIYIYTHTHVECASYEINRYLKWPDQLKAYEFNYSLVKFTVYLRVAQQKFHMTFICLSIVFFLSFCGFHHIWPISHFNVIFMSSLFLLCLFNLSLCSIYFHRDLYDFVAAGRNIKPKNCQAAGCSAVHTCLGIRQMGLVLTAGYLLTHQESMSIKIWIMNSESKCFCC